MAGSHGVRKTVTVLFSDVTGSTALGEQLDPEVTRRLLGSYFEEVRAVIERHGGTVEKFIGDAVMAVFGVPTAREDDALRAVRAAVEMRAAVEAGGLPFETRTGVNTGEVVAGAGETLVTGDAVNVAARLEQSAAPGEILVGATTHHLVRDAVEAERVEPLEVKGKAERIPAWRMIRVIEGAPGIARRLDAPLVGRARELEQLRAEFGRACDVRRPQLVTVIGDAGIGKSRLSRELVSLLAHEATALAGRCLPYGEGITYWPLVDVVRRGAPDGVGALLAGREDARWIAERVAAAVGESEVGTAPDEIVLAVRRLLEHLARQRPLLLEIDDIQWAEPRFLELLETIALLSHDAPILLLCLARPELLERRPEWPGTIVRLDPLTPAESATLLEGVGAELARELRARIAETAGGNPLFLEQMGALAGQERHGEGLAVPPSIDALLTARLDRLERGERETIERASVVGQEFWSGAVRSLAPDGEEVGSALLGLMRKQLIHPSQSVFPDEDGFRFAHLLVRDAAYRGMSKVLRADLHERFADWIDAKDLAAGTRHDEIVGYHLEQAYRYRHELGLVDEAARARADQAADRLAGAGRRAFARGDMPAVANLLTRARDLLGEEDRRRAELAPHLSSALADVGDLAAGMAVLAEARRLADGLSDTRLQAHVRLAELWLAVGASDMDLASTRRELNALLSVFEAADDDVGLATTWFLIGANDWLESRAAVAEEAYWRAIEHARAAGDRWLEMEILAQILSATPHGPTPVDDGLRRCARLLEEARDAPLVEAAVLRALGRLHAMQGDFARARSEMSRGLEIIDELGLRLQAESSRGQGATFIEWLAGDLEAVERTLRASYHALDEMGETGFLSTTAALLGTVLVDLARLEEALDFAERSRDLAAPEDLASQVGWRWARGRALARGGEFKEAERLLREAVDLAERTDFLNMRADTLNYLAEVLRFAGRGDEAADALRRAIEIYETKGNVVAAQRTRAQLKELRAGVS